MLRLRIFPLSSIIYLLQIYTECEIGGDLPPQECSSLVSHYHNTDRCMNLPKTNYNDRTHKNDANTLS